ncbi:MAG TPA: MucBP domain-containing protein, partial [Candidatus Kurthia intestinigallinarum]|nr:MucBP domain-containing protein [Candidatus Kurthia intestinigallinarum]
QDTTTSLKDSITHKGKVGESFPQTGADIEGYKLVNTVGSPSGSFTAGEQTITYYYTKNPVVEPPVVELPVVEPPVVEMPKEVENPETPVTPPDTIPEENIPSTVVQVSNPPKTTTMVTTPPAVETASTTTPTLQNPAQASTLPQTGDAATKTGLMGGMLLALSALAGVFGLRKRKTEK